MPSRRTPGTQQQRATTCRRARRCSLCAAPWTPCARRSVCCGRRSSKAMRCGRARTRFAVRRANRSRRVAATVAVATVVAVGRRCRGRSHPRCRLASARPLALTVESRRTAAPCPRARLLRKRPGFLEVVGPDRAVRRRRSLNPRRRSRRPRPQRLPSRRHRRAGPTRSIASTSWISSSPARAEGPPPLPARPRNGRASPWPFGFSRLACRRSATTMAAR